MFELSRPYSGVIRLVVRRHRPALAGSGYGGEGSDVVGARERCRRMDSEIAKYAALAVLRARNRCGSSEQDSFRIPLIVDQAEVVVEGRTRIGAIYLRPSPVEVFRAANCGHRNRLAHHLRPDRRTAISCRNQQCSGLPSARDRLGPGATSRALYSQHVRRPMVLKELKPVSGVTPIGWLVLSAFRQSQTG
jgi:hypothetical protein